MSTNTHAIVTSNTGFKVKLTPVQSAVYQVLLSKASLIPFQLGYKELGKLVSRPSGSVAMAIKYLRESRLISCHLGKYDRRNVFTHIDG